MPRCNFNVIFLFCCVPAKIGYSAVATVRRIGRKRSFPFARGSTLPFKTCRQLKMSLISFVEHVCCHCVHFRVSTGFWSPGPEFYSQPTVLSSRVWYNDNWKWCECMCI